MLSKDKRLNLKKDFNWVASGKKLQTNSFSIFIKSGTNQHPMVGIALKKAVFKKAHDRNFARRLTSRAVETLYPNLPNNLNLVIMPKTTVFNASVESLVKELQNVFPVDHGN